MLTNDADFAKPTKSRIISLKLVGSEDFGEVIKMYDSILSMHIMHKYRR